MAVKVERSINSFFILEYLVAVIGTFKLVFILFGI